MDVKLREAIRLASERGVKIEHIGQHVGFVGWWVQKPGEKRVRIPSASRLLKYLAKDVQL